MSTDDFEIYENELGISPIGMVIVLLLTLIGLAIFLNPKSSLYDTQIAGVIVLSIALASMSKIQLLHNEGDLIKTLTTGIIGAAIMSVICAVAAIATFTGSTIQGGNVLGLALVNGLPTVFEELLFRGSAFLIVRRILGTWPAVIIQDVLFTAFHAYRNPDIVYTLVLFAGGIVLMLVFLISRNLLSSMISHAIVNLRPFVWQIILNPGTLAGLAIVLAITYAQWRFL